jgi:hypothetical protein
MSALGTYLDLLFGAEPEGAFVELRWKLHHGTGMGRDFIGVRDPRLTNLICARGAETDLYVGAAPRARQDGTRAGIERAHVLWADVDGTDALDALRGFRPRPSLVVRSGSPDSAHAYWALWPPADPDEVERGNRRLAHHLGADVQATDAARILRPPGTLNYKLTPPRPVEVAHLEAETFTVAEVVGQLPDPSQARAPRSRRPRFPRRAARDRARLVRRGPDRPRDRARREGRVPVPRRPHALAAHL